MTGPSRIEAMAAATAIVVSVASLYIAIRQTSVMERQLEATVWPSLGFDTNNYVDGKATIHMSVKNGGIGPARVRSVEVGYHGKPAEDALSLLKDCCGLEDNPRAVKSLDVTFLNGRIIPAGQELPFLVFDLGTESEPVWNRLNEARFDVDGRICFCSALEQCWTVGFKEREPSPIHDCVEASKRPQYKQ
jgi:hypothetical protein